MRLATIIFMSLFGATMLIVFTRMERQTAAIPHENHSINRGLDLATPSLAPGTRTGVAHE